MKKICVCTLAIGILVSLLLLVGCAVSSETEQSSPSEAAQPAASEGELSLDNEPLVIEKSVVATQEESVPEEEEPSTQEVLVTEDSLGQLEKEQPPEEILSHESKEPPVLDDAVPLVSEKPIVTSLEQPKPEKPLPLGEASTITPVSIPSGRAAKPDSATVAQESPQENTLENTVIANERRPMQTPILFLGILIILVIMLIRFLVRERKLQQRFEAEQSKLQEVNALLEAEQAKLQGVHSRLEAESDRIRVLGITTIEEAQRKQKELEATITAIESQLIALNDEYLDLQVLRGALGEDYSKLEKKVDNQKLKLARTKELYIAIEHAVQRFHATEIPSIYFRPLTEEEKKDLDTIAPSVILNLNYMNYQDIRKEFRANQKQIDMLLEAYADRYTTKANQSIYKLMVISLRSELQNILYNLKYEKLENALLQVQSLVAKYLVIVSEGNQQVAGTMRKFVGELEHLFANAVKIEYEYFIKKEQARQEQLALRQQMREEAEERRRLEEQKKQIALEESKYQAEIDKIQEMLEQEAEDSPKRFDIQARLDQLNSQLAQVEEKKEEITKLQNGKAGNVYIISNLGSFGEHVFKIGMTRRLDPQDRVDELGSASVPFKFDVHSFIFSDDAVGLEGELHQRLHTRRINKVNLRKEFFDVSVEELEQLVTEINPTAEFNRTMLADDYKQSLSLGDQELPFASPIDDDQEEDEEELGTGEDEL